MYRKLVESIVAMVPPGQEDTHSEWVELVVESAFGRAQIVQRVVEAQ